MGIVELEGHGHSPKLVDIVARPELVHSQASISKALQVLGPHDHCCQIQESPNGWRAQVVPFFQIGALRGERCIYIVSHQTADDVRGLLCEGNIDVAAAEDLDQLVILFERETYTQGGHFDPDRVIALLIAETQKALDEGYSALRVMGDMSWAITGGSGTERLLEYEAKLNRDFFPKYPCTAICTYDRWKFGPGTIKGILLTHPLIMRGERIYHHHPIPPEDLLRDRCNDFEVNCWLQNFEHKQESQERARLLADILERSPQPFAAGLSDGTLIAINHGFCELTGHNREELLKTHWTTNLMPEGWHPKDFEIEPRPLRGDQPRRYQKDYMRKDRSTVPIEILLHKVAAPVGGTEYYFAFITDISERQQVERALKNSLRELHNAIEGTIQVLSRVAENRDPYTADHQRRTAQLACAIARRLGLPQDVVKGIAMAGVIHDLGKICVPAEILSKPGQLSMIERDLVRSHATAGYELLKDVQFPWPIAQIVLQHHERWDGSGYPAGLSGSAILREARIMGVADTIESMSSHRPYRPALGIDKALEEISQNSGVLYDPEVADACIRLFADGTVQLEDLQ